MDRIFENIKDKSYKLFIADWNKTGDRKETAAQFSQNAYLFGSIVVHAILLIYFTVFADFLCIILNVNSIVLNLVCLLINRRKRHDATMIVSSCEAIIYGTISVCLMGWETGFQWYLIIAFLPYYLFIYTSRAKKMFITALAVICFYFGYFYCVANVIDPLNTERTIIAFINLNVILAAIFMEIKINEIALSINSQYIEKLKTAANQDPLTGLWNRRYAESFFENGLNLSKEWCVALIDIDYFKKINDTYGHEVGDLTLVEFSKFLLKSFRVTDTVIRWGGEEILVILHQIGLDKAYKIMDNIRAVAGETVYSIGGNKIKFTITIGLVKAEAHKSANEIIRESDSCMYFGKENGRNQVVTMEMMKKGKSKNQG